MSRGPLVVKMRLKVINGTPSSEGDGLCITCLHSQVARTENAKVMIKCHAFESQIHDKIVECDTYRHKNQPSIHAMEEIAWILKTDPKRNKIGFVPHKDLPEQEKYITRGPL